MNLKQELNLQLFADAGTLVNASGQLRERVFR